MDHHRAPQGDALTVLPDSGSRPTAAALAWVAEKTRGARLIAVRLLAGGTMHSNYAIALAPRGQRRVVLRQWMRRGPQRDHEFTVDREAAALTLLERSDIPAPRLIAADRPGDRCGAPALLMTFLPGRPPRAKGPPPARFLEQLAAAALALHRTAAPLHGMPAYRPYNALVDPRPPRASTRPARWQRAFAVLADAPPSEREAFVHRDFHPGNTLWLRGKLTGVVDWITASRSPAGVDLGHMRWNLVLQHGEPAAGTFLRAYCRQSEGAYNHHPYWDLRTLVDLLPDHDPTAQELARLEPYLARLLARC